MASIIERKSGLNKIASTFLRRNYTLVASSVKNFKKPIEITVNGKVDLIMMDLEFFEGLMNLIEDYQDELAVIYFESRKDVSDKR